METPIPEFYKRPSGCTIDNAKALEAVHSLIDWNDLETPARLAFALNWLFGELSGKEEIPKDVKTALLNIGLFLENLQDALSVSREAEQTDVSGEHSATLKELFRVKEEHFDLLKKYQQLLEQQRQFPRTNKN